MKIFRFLPAAALSFFVQAAPVQAASDNCVYGDGFRICLKLLTMEQNNGELWAVTLNNTHKSEELLLHCRNRRMVNYKSQGTYSTHVVGKVARQLCRDI